MSEELRVAIDAGVACLTMDRPRLHNALDGALIRDMNVALDRIQRSDSAVRAVLLTGSGSSFCSGIDLRSVDLSTAEAQQRAHAEMRRYLDPLILRLAEFRLPVIAAINGAAVGAGMSLALVADILIAADTAYFEPSFIRLGFVPDGGISYHLARKIGGGRSIAALLMAERIAAATALDWGLVYEVTTAANLSARAQQIATQLAAGPACAIAKLRTLNASVFNHSLRQHLQAEQLAQRDSVATGDCVEGVKAFFEKRAPAFRNRSTRIA
jgi:2-(1,2-epoxy-1,2-dihydrophenyl)acetyl-CoA isomerase